MERGINEDGEIDVDNLVLTRSLTNNKLYRAARHRFCHRMLPSLVERLGEKLLNILCKPPEASLLINGLMLGSHRNREYSNFVWMKWRMHCIDFEHKGNNMHSNMAALTIEDAHWAGESYLMLMVFFEPIENAQGQDEYPFGKSSFYTLERTDDDENSMKTKFCEYINCHRHFISDYTLESIDLDKIKYELMDLVTHRVHLQIQKLSNRGYYCVR